MGLFDDLVPAPPPSLKDVPLPPTRPAEFRSEPSAGGLFDDLIPSAAPSGPPPSKLGQFGFGRPGVPEAFNRSYRNREIQQAATKEVLGGQARGFGELATLPGRSYTGEVNLNDPGVLNQGIALGMMISPGSVVGRGLRIPAREPSAGRPHAMPSGGLTDRPPYFIDPKWKRSAHGLTPEEEASFLKYVSTPYKPPPRDPREETDAHHEAEINEFLGKPPVAPQAPAEGAVPGGLDRPHAVSPRGPEPIRWNHAPHEITQEPPGEPQIIRKKGPTGKPPILGKPKVASPKGAGESSNAFKEKMKAAKALGYDTKTTYFHGTGIDFEEFTQPYGSEPAVFLTTDPNIASVYAGAHIESVYAGGGKPNVIPLLLKKGKTKTVDWKKVTGQDHYSSASMKYILNQAKAQGYDTVFINNIHDIGSNGAAQKQIAVLNPVGHLRAKFGAKFDPAMAASGNMLSAQKTTQQTTAVIKPGKGIWGKPTAGRNLLRQQIGSAGRDTEVTQQRFEQHRKLSNKLTIPENIELIRYMQHRSTTGPLGKLTLPKSAGQPVQDMADAIRKGYLEREAKLKALDEFTRMQFEEDHFTQKWQDRDKAKAVWDGWMTKEGNRGFTKKKKYLDFDAGLAAGLTPKSYNVVDVALNDFAHQDRVIALSSVREIAENQGYLKWAYNARGVPSDWVPLEGYGAEKPRGPATLRAYAPADFARNYNNFVGRGWNATSLAGQAQALRSMTNGLTQLELSFSAYHGFTITREAIATGVADAVYELAHGRPVQAAKNIGKAALAPLYYAAKGRKAGQIYLGLSPGSGLESRAIEALVQANAHLGKLEPALISGKTHSLVTQYQRGAIAKDIENSLRHIREAEGFWRKVGTTGVEAGRAVSEVLNTISWPLFQMYIPAVKRGMMMDQMTEWLRSHPSASWDQILDQSGELSDIADERMGEMRQDNLFWNPLVKQSAQIAMRSTSWAYGSWTQYAGGVKELTSIPSRGVGRRTSYLFADLFTTALIGGITTKLMTGKDPNDWHDFVWPRTGGTTTVLAGNRSYQVPERINLPGSIKEIVGLMAAIMDVPEQGLKGFADYAKNKENDFFRTMGEVITNEDWRGAPLINPYRKDRSVMQQWFDVGLEGVGLPLAFKQDKPGVGSALDFPGANLLGVRPAGRRWIDPKGYKEGVEFRLKRAAKSEESYQRRKQRALGQQPLGVQ